MSDLVFNDEVTATWGFPFQPQTVHKTTEVRSIAGTRQSFLNSDHDQKIFYLDFYNLTNAEFESLQDFYDDRNGAHDSFLFYDAREYAIASENIGTADGSLLTFQITDNGFSRWNIVSGSYTVWHDGNEMTDTVDYNIDITDDGRVISTSPWGAGAVLTTYQFYRRVHFLNRELNPVESDYQIWNVSGVTLEEILVAI